jgi:hypothetical protein
MINELSQFLDAQIPHDSLVGRLARGEALAGAKLHAACKRAAFMLCGSSNWNDVLYEDIKTEHARRAAARA